MFEEDVSGRKAEATWNDVRVVNVESALLVVLFVVLPVVAAQRVLQLPDWLLIDTTAIFHSSSTRAERRVPFPTPVSTTCQCGAARSHGRRFDVDSADVPKV